MRILALTINYWPEQTGIGTLLTRRCEYLASVGHEVTVCTGMPYYPEWRVHPNYKHKLFHQETRNGIKILRSWIWVPRKVTSSKRVVFEASFLATSIVRALGADKPDLLLTVSPPLGLAVSARVLSLRWRIPYVFDVEDLQPDAASDLGMLPRPVLPFLYRLEAIGYRKAALISTVTEGMRQKIIAKGVPEDKVVVTPPPADRCVFQVGSAEDSTQFRGKHGLNGKFIVAHSGNMGVKQGLNLVLDAATRLKERREIVFLLAGDGAMKPHLQSRAAALRLDNVRFLPLQDQRDFLKMLAAIDLALIVQQSTVSDIAFPSKTVTLLAAARPVIAAVRANSEIGRVIRQSEGGVVIQPEDADALADTIQKLDNPAIRVEIGKCGRRYALRHWDETRMFSEFESHMLRAAGTLAETLEEEPAA
jgi:colanic acid biosynthesis glycosyl transferase WcaI